MVAITASRCHGPRLSLGGPRVRIRLPPAESRARTPGLARLGSVIVPKRHSIRKPMTLPPAAQPKIGRDRPSVLEMSVPSPTTDQIGRAGRGHPTADFRPAGALGRSVRVKPPRSGAKAGGPGIGTEEPKPPMIEFGGSCHLAAIGVQIAKSHSRTCAPSGRGACPLVSVRTLIVLGTFHPKVKA